MFSLFSKFTSGVTEIRKFPYAPDSDGYQTIHIPGRTIQSKNPVWVRKKTIAESSKGKQKEISNRVLEEGTSSGILQLKKEDRSLLTDQKKVLYSIGPWQPYRANMRQLPFLIKEGERLLRSPDRKEGMADAMRLARVTTRTAKMKRFWLAEAIVKSYLIDIRFVSLLCLLIGFSVWWASAPEELINKPMTLASTDLQLLVRATRDTFINKVCVLHQVQSPCECGEIINKATKHLLEDKGSYDPLGINDSGSERIKSLAVFIAAIIITMALAESVSTEGFRWS